MKNKEFKVYLDKYIEKRMDELIEKGKRMSKRDFIKLIYMSGVFDMKEGRIKVTYNNKNDTITKTTN